MFSSSVESRNGVAMNFTLHDEDTVILEFLDTPAGFEFSLTDRVIGC